MDILQCLAHFISRKLRDTRGTLNCLTQLTNKRTHHIVVHCTLNIWLAMLTNQILKHSSKARTDLTTNLRTNGATKHTPNNATDHSTN
ncbi:hypothetical protein A3197_12290 [Candidatus Thiodiazotropha endoloripes]|nr:hypothetical protein A3197_12290 [Candidatus Thiodiazotropha endoloripes]